tara:strand:+ start:2333 stop:2560 length:228 start_codon:yes stop_codon:yes gene_type:complete
MAYGHGRNTTANSKHLAANGGYTTPKKATWRDDHSHDRLRVCKVCDLAIDVPRGTYRQDVKTDICTLCEGKNKRI